MARRILISVTNDLGTDQRVHRVAMTLLDMGFEVCLIGRQRRKSVPLAPRPYPTRRFRYLFEQGKLFYVAYAFRMFWWLLFQRVDILLANDMDTLLPNFLVAKLRRKTLVYDSHEYWTEVPELVERPVTRAVWLWMERWMFPRVDAAMTVNGSIARIYAEKYGVPVHVVRNMPFYAQAPLEAAPKEKVLLYQGALNIGRGVELMIEAMRYLPDYRLVVVGTGTIEEPLRKLAAAKPFGQLVEFKGYVQAQHLRSVTSQAVLGMSLEEDRGASYHLALPNKLFDYIQAGVPVLVSDLPEMAAVVRDHGVGEVLAAQERDPEGLARRIRSICENSGKYAAYAANCHHAATVLNWENEKNSLKALLEPFRV